MQRDISISAFFSSDNPKRSSAHEDASLLFKSFLYIGYLIEYAVDLSRRLCASPLSVALEIAEHDRDVLEVVHHPSIPQQRRDVSYVGKHILQQRFGLDLG